MHRDLHTGPPVPRATLCGWAAGFFLLLVSACSTVSPPGPELSPGQGSGAGTASLLRSRSDLKPLSVPAIGDTLPRWQPLSADGDLSVFAGRTKKPRLEFWAVRVVLAGQRILIDAGPGEGIPRFGHVASTRVSSFVRDNGLWVGINTVPFEPSSAREGEDRRVVGLGLSEGRLIAPPVARYDALVFYRDGRAAIVGQQELSPRDSADSPDIPPEILHATGGFHCILRDGELTERARRESPRYARSAVGISADGRTLYLLAINGGLLTKRGATEAETALLLKQLGAHDALNLDGGGSSALVLRFADGVRVLNTPAHAGLPGWERAVALCLGIGPRRSGRDPADSPPRP
ncbi:MAG: phosphodiester glycosidase family protein [Treponema sp.]|nr:phosphodiester glycosidase family protein [Treponema sp.]